MLSFSPTPKLEKALKDLQGEIVLLADQLSALDEFEKQWLHKSALISTIGASTRIENAVLTDAEIEWVDTTLTHGGKTTDFYENRASILNKLSQDKERSIEEVVGCRELLNLAYLQGDEFFPLSETILRGMHKILLNYYPEALEHAGDYKKTPNLVISVNHATKERRTVLDPTPPGPLTQTAMQDLLVWYNHNIQTHPWPLLVATEFVFRFLAIHPFQDGNGRIGRALFLIALMQGDDLSLKKVIYYVSIDRQIERHRSLYYKTLQDVSKGRYRSDPSQYHFEPLAWFFLKMMRLSFNDVMTLRQRYRIITRLSENGQRILSCFKSTPEKRLSVSDIMKETDLGRRVVQNSLVSLVKGGILQFLGAGPSSRYQLIF